jgi:hypothetical protein
MRSRHELLSCPLIVRRACPADAVRWRRPSTKASEEGEPGASAAAPSDDDSSEAMGSDWGALGVSDDPSSAARWVRPREGCQRAGVQEHR